MCHERWFRRRERDERFEEELRFLLDDQEREPEPPTPIVQCDPDADADDERVPEEPPVVRK
jgi:hypothetical protein